MRGKSENENDVTSTAISMNKSSSPIFLVTLSWSPRTKPEPEPETTILSRRTILDILQQQQCKLFLRKRDVFTQRAEADVENEIDRFFQPERLFALEGVHFFFLYV